MTHLLNALNFFLNHFELVAVAIIGVIVAWQIQKVQSQSAAANNILKKAISAQNHEPLTLHPEIDPALCLGCGACTKVCPEGDILKLINHKAVLVSPSKCVGHGECERSCPMGAISLVFGTKTKGMDIPRLTSNYETNVPGLYIAGELGGMGLIRNAVKQGVLAAQHALSQPPSSEKVDTELLVIGAGPAGLAASLVAISKKTSYTCIDQNSFGGTVYNFPRQKVVMSHPADLPIVGKMKFSNNKVSKEELLGYWNEIKKQTGLKVKEKVKFETLEKEGHIFRVKTSAGEIKARRVILAMGVRGSPRRLGLPNEDLPKVAYSLLDPEQYQSMNVAVVGGGNAAVEAAQYLAKERYKNRVTLLVRGATFDRCNEENQKIIFDLGKRGLVKILFESSVTEIKSDSIQYMKSSQPAHLKNDYLFIFAGAEMPHKFLMDLGIKIDKKFGEAQKKAT